MFAARLATAVALLAACIAALLLLPNRWWTVALLPVLLVASWEWNALAGFGRAVGRAFSAVVLASALVLWSAALAGDTVYLDVVVYGAGCAFWWLAVPAWLAHRRRVRDPLALAVAGWLVLVPAWLALSRMQSEPLELLAVLGIVWLSDTAAYVSGSAWGRRRLAPDISPGKTWEGVAGTVVAVAVYYVALSGVAPEWSWWKGAGGALLFAGVTVMGVAGDLFESWIKRQAGVKDSGRLLPGHGGVLDRIDSLTASMPLAALLLLFIDWTGRA